ncbi:hypothetical protein LXA43DRAFT_979923 [Ganoderma leucocontextum]|nr:hypothetical protein LXA43DRAFT_979923 [Ganoderma leucocontextum]
MMVAPVILVWFTGLYPDAHRSLHRPLRTVHSALCTRVLINLRKAAVCTSGTTMGEFTMDTTLVFRSVDAMLPSPETEEPRHYASQPRQLGHQCSFQEIVFTSDSASEVGAGEWT